ncbi:MAG: hypothetical protein K2N94_08950 [Lachnospiraceae bacterium]|nr:hypothetical protein [Lachnospiraceae bacterium]
MGSKTERSRSGRTSCDSCANYRYDEEYEYYVCEVNLDEDEMSRFLRGSVESCPYYRRDDEYAVVRKQI